MTTNKISEVYVTITIDTECDHDTQWVRSDPLTFESITCGLPERLQPAFESVGAVPTYLLTVEVLEDDASVQALRSLTGNFEYGTHLHAAFIEPQKKFHDYAGVDSPDFQSSYAPEIEFRKLENLTRLFTEKLDRIPTSFRAGRYGAGVSTIDSLTRLGYKVDTSVTPHIRWTEPNGVADYRQALEQPYFPKPGTLLMPDTSVPSTVLEVPVTVRKRLLRRTPMWFRPWFASVDEMKSVARYHLNRYRHLDVINLNMMFHSMEIIEKASPYPQTREQVQSMLDDMVAVLDWCRQEGFRFCGVSDLHDICLQEQTGGNSLDLQAHS